MTETLHFERALLPEGWADNVRLTLENGKIASVKRAVSPALGDERHAIGLPGLPNLHSHAFQRGMAGLAESRGPAGDSFWTWREIMYRFVDQLLLDDLSAIAALAYVEMLESGFTRVGEFHYLHHATDGSGFDNPAEMSLAIIEAAAQTGIALTHLPVFYAHSGFGGMAPGTGQRRFISDLDGFATLLDGVRGSAAAALHRGWISLKDALTGDDAGSVLGAAVTGEDHAVSEYEKGLEQDLSAGFREVLRTQHAAVVAARDEVKGLQVAD